MISDSLSVCPPLADLDELAAGDLRTLVLQLFAEVSALKRVVAEQRAEIVRLQGLKGPPSIKPSGMEQASSGKPGSSGVAAGGKLALAARDYRGPEHHRAIEFVLEN